MKSLRNLIARLLRQPLMPAAPAAVSQVNPQDKPSRLAHAWAVASVPRRARPAAAAPAPDEGVSPMHASMLLSLLSAEGNSADAGSFGSGWDVPASFE
ncbi:hypothetical protein BJN34_12870 [Cupriavidus necator]|uniref:Uncharacterized protein n=1 Tax=Cupriavidus necator TaxID=106590 RepID=A0A1U9UQ48_CUPNE|nr:hypothetical protein [Cupriavidus necator]AQV94773.1 hypothetical protein BJN34_12870 [Cupriavidus necator]